MNKKLKSYFFHRNFGDWKTFSKLTALFINTWSIYDNVYVYMQFFMKIIWFKRKIDGNDSSADSDITK